jgi:hypothetical protein
VLASWRHLEAARSSSSRASAARRAFLVTKVSKETKVSRASKESRATRVRRAVSASKDRLGARESVVLLVLLAVTGVLVSLALRASKAPKESPVTPEASDRPVM